METQSNTNLAGSENWRPGVSFRFPRNLLGRLLLLAVFLVPDVLLLAGAPHATALLGALAPFGIVAYAVFVGLGFPYLRRQRQPLRFGTGLFLAHLSSLALVSAANLAVSQGAAPWLLLPAGLMALRLLVLLGLALLALACVPLAAWMATWRETGLLWLHAALAGALAWCLRYPLQSMWSASSSAPGRALQALAFHSVEALLRLVLPQIAVDPESFTIRAPNFAIIVAEGCSGLEGLGLVLVFTTVWLWYFRKESRFPQALLLVPCALVSVWALNILRICVLVWIGNAGHRGIAMVGFHSQAGWIAFTTVAFGFSMAARQLSWVRKMPENPAHSAAPAGSQTFSNTGEDAGESPATGAYLLPFLAILGAGFVSKAASSYFEWLYPLRFVAAAIALRYSWPELKKLDWRIGWLAPVTGAGVFAIWLLPSLWLHPQASVLGASLAGLSPAARWTWIGFRVAAASVTVPLAEELAFRGYLARRLVDRRFEAIPFSAVAILPICLSSVAFGLMHGGQWIVGIAAGLAFAGVMRWKGRLTDAIAAHATCNLLLAIWVLARGDWAQW